LLFKPDPYLIKCTVTNEPTKPIEQPIGTREGPATKVTVQPSSTPAVRIVGRGDGVVVQVNQASGAWPQTLEMLDAHLSQANGFFRGERITVELGLQPVAGPDLQQLLNMLAQQEIGLRLLKTSNEKVYQLAQDLGLPVDWQSAELSPLHPDESAVGANANWEVLLSGKRPPAQIVADFQMPPAIIDAIADAMHQGAVTGKPSKVGMHEQSIAPAIHSTLIANPTDPDLVQRLSAPPYLYRGNLRSGQIFRHAGSVVVIGDVNPGAQVVSASDVYIWGKLRGIVHAGAMGDEKAIVGALDFDPIQVRIAGHIAISPKAEARDPGRWFWKRDRAGRPEIAQVLEDRIVVDQWDARMKSMRS
jgi:septum formation inhibitor MinC